MDYGEILKRAWDTIWKHKILWVFGLLASCTANSGGGGGGGGGRSGSPGTNFNFNGGDFLNNNNFPQNFDFGNNFNNMPDLNNMFSGSGNEGMLILAIILGVFCLMLIFSVVAIIVGSAGQIGLSRGAWWVDEGETDITFSRIWNSIGKPFWRVVLIHVALTAIGIVLGLLIGGIIVLAAVLTLGIALICLIPFFCIFGLLSIFVGLLISSLIQYMIQMIVNEDMTFMDALKGSYELLKNNFWPSVLMALILGVIQFVIGLIITIPITILFLGIAGVGAFATVAADMSPSVLIVIGIAALCLIMPIAWFISAVLQSYVGSAWAIAYRRLTGRVFGSTAEKADFTALSAESEVVEAKDEEEQAPPEEPEQKEPPKKKPRSRKKKTDETDESKE